MCSARRPAIAVELEFQMNACGQIACGRDEKARQVGADEGRAARLLGRHVERALAFALRGIDIDPARAPAGVPDLPVGIAHRAVETANAGMAQQHLRLAARQAGRGIERDAIEHVARGVGEIACHAIRREADRIGNADAGKQRRELAAVKRIDRARAGLGLSRLLVTSAWQDMSILGIGIDYQQVIKGLVLLGAVCLDVYNQRR